MRRYLCIFLIMFVTILGVSCKQLFYNSNKDGSAYGKDIEPYLYSSNNSFYLITKKIDLNGKSFSIPRGSTLEFKGGEIVNGYISFDSVDIKGRPQFRNCIFDGSIIIEKLDDRCFESKDDMRTFQFLIKNAIENGIRCDLYRDYKISMKDASGVYGLISFANIDSGAEIVFHGNTIYNIYAFKSETIKPLITFRNVKNVTFRDCMFHDIDEHNCHNFKRSSGCTFIHCYGDCGSINLLNCNQENGDCILRSGVWVHSEDRPADTPCRGLYNSTIKIKSNNVGYGLALYCGDSLDLDITVNNPHRGFYCSGVSNSKIRYEGYNPLETKTHILIKDAVYQRIDSFGNVVLDMKGCDHLDINAYITEIQPRERIIGFQSYGTGLKEGADFRFRSSKCHHHDISVTATINHYPNSGYYYICDFLQDSGTKEDSEVYGCIVSGLLIHDININRGTPNVYICNLEKHAEVYAVINNCGHEGKSIEKNTVSNIQVRGNAKGRIQVSHSFLGAVLIREKQIENFDVLVDNKSVIKNGLNFINDGTNRTLVRMLRQ